MQQRGAAFIPGLTTARGLVAWWVALYHFREYLPVPWHSTAGQVINAGPYGVDFFFILSGFVLQINYAVSLAQPDAARLRAFAVARFARVYPLHLCMLLIYLVIPASIMLFSSQATLGGRYSVEYYLLSVLLLQNWGFTDQLTWNVPAWSISTEFAAYLLFPLAAIVVMRARSLMSAGALLLGMLIGTALLFWMAGRPSLAADISRWGLVRCILEFLIGMSFGRIFQLTGPPAPWPQAGLLLLGLGLVTAVLAGLLADYIGLPGAFGLIVLALTASTGALARLLAWRVLVYLGEISYATYLVHYFVREVIKFMLPTVWGVDWGASGLFIGSTLAASVVLYHAVEFPARRFLRPQAGIRVGPNNSPSSGLAQRMSR